MFVTLFGIVTLVSPLQPENVSFPMFVMPLPMVTLPLQPESNPSWISVTLFGKVTLVNPLAMATTLVPSLVSNNPESDL